MFDSGDNNEEAKEDDLIEDTGDIPMNVNVSNLFLGEEVSANLGNSSAVAARGVQDTSLTSVTPASSASSAQKWSAKGVGGGVHKEQGSHSAYC